MAKPGCGPLAAIFIIAFVLLFAGANEGVGYYFTECDDVEFLDCVMQIANEEEAEEEDEGTVTATGVYTYKDYSVTMTANIPLGGGAVTGTVDGTCEAKVKGTYDGKPNGVISGTMTGVCAPFFVNIPASALFTGTVNKSAKTVPISFTGKGAGVMHEGATVMGYP